MRIFPGFFLSLMLPVLFSTGCRKGEEQAVDQSYLNSDNYRQFKQQSLKERSSRSDGTTVFNQVLENLLRHPQTEELGLPFRMDSLNVDKYLQSSVRFDITQSMLNEPSQLDYTYYPIGKIQRKGINALVFLIEKGSIYEDLEIAVASFTGTSPVDVQSVAKFKKTISQRVYSTVRVDRSLHIISGISREQFYPVRQANKITYEYKIDSKGKIGSEILSKGH